MTVEPDNYDCHANISFAFLHPIAPHYSTLLKFDAANYPQVVGDLAESWTVSPDRLTYTFKLRPNVLFHDGSKLTSADVKASYERIIHPPPGVVSARQVDYAAISRHRHARPAHGRVPPELAGSGDAGEFRLALELHLQRGQARRGPAISRKRTCWEPDRLSLSSMSRASTGRGAAGRNISGRGGPISTAIRPISCRPAAVMKAYESGKILAEFRGVTPAQRDELTEALGDRITVSESPWLSNLLGRLQHQTRAVRRCSGATGAVARDRPLGCGGTAAEHDFLEICRRPDAAGLQHGRRRKASSSSLPGFSRDIAAARAEARRLLAEAGVHDLKLTLLVRDIPMPHFAGADLLAESWREIGVTTTQQRLNIWEWQKLVDQRRFRCSA